MARKSPAAAAPVVAPVVAAPAEVPAAPAKVTRPVTCGAWVKANGEHPAAEGRLVTCKRLPRHAGDCRAHRTISAERKSAAPKTAPKTAAKVVNTRVTRGQILAAAQDLAAGKMTPAAYMSLVARMGQFRAKRALKVNATA